MNIGIIHLYPSKYLLESLTRLGHSIYLFSPYDPQLDSVYWQYDPFVLGSSIIDELVDSGKNLQISIFPPVYEGATEIVAEVSEQLEIPCFSVDAAKSSRNKYRASKLWSEAGVPIPTTIPIEPSSVNWNDITSKLKPPFIIKLADSMNSQGVMKVNNESEYYSTVNQLVELISLPEKLDYSMDRNRVAYGKSDISIIAQEYLDGTEYSVDLVFSDGHYSSLGIFEKAPPFGDYFVESASISPPSLDKEEQQQLVALAVTSVKQLGAIVGSAHVEIMKTDAGFRVIEVGLRPGGGYTTRCIEILHSINPFETLLNVLTNSAGDLAVFKKEVKTNGHILFGGIPYPDTGILTDISGLQILQDSPLVQEYIQLNDIGENVYAAPKSAQPHFAYYVIHSSSRDEIWSLHIEIQHTVKLLIEEIK